MRVGLSGVEELALPPLEVWALLLDHEFVASCAPGIESVERLGAHRFRAVSRFGAGAVRIRFRFEVSLADLVEAESLTMTARGKAPGTEVAVTTSLRLEGYAERTRLEWTASVDSRGLLARIGARLLKGETERQLREFWRSFAEGGGTPR